MFRPVSCRVRKHFQRSAVTKALIGILLCAAPGFAQPNPAEQKALKLPKLEVSIENGPELVIGGKHFTTQWKVQRIRTVDAQGRESVDEAMEWFRVLDAKEIMQWEKTWEVNVTDTGFDWATTVEAFRLEGASGDGLLLELYTLPSAPEAGGEDQILWMKDGRLVPLGEPIAVEGDFVAMEEVKATHTKKLAKRDLLQMSEWTGNFHVTTAVVIDLKNGTMEPSCKAQCYLEAKTESAAKQTGKTIRLYATPDASATVQTVTVRKLSKITFGRAYVDAMPWSRPDEDAEPNHVPWLEVTIDGVKGWMMDPEELGWVGLPMAG